MQFRVTHLDDISTSALHGYQVVLALNDEPGPRSVYGNKGKHASKSLIKSLVKLMILDIG